MKYIVFDIVRCLLKNMVLSSILQGQFVAPKWNELKFVAIASLVVNHTVKTPSWYKRQGFLWSVMSIEYQT